MLILIMSNQKGFDLERGMFVEDTGRKHYTIEEYKKITNYENTKKVLNDIKLLMMLKSTKKKGIQ